MLKNNLHFIKYKNTIKILKKFIKLLKKILKILKKNKKIIKLLGINKYMKIRDILRGTNK